MSISTFPQVEARLIHSSMTSGSTVQLYCQLDDPDISGSDVQLDLPNGGTEVLYRAWAKALLDGIQPEVREEDVGGRNVWFAVLVFDRYNTLYVGWGETEEAALVQGTATIPKLLQAIDNAELEEYP